MTSISLENVSLTYPVFGKAEAGGRIEQREHGGLGVKALDGVSLRLHEGDRLGLVGRNGSGKSTLLRVIAGIYAPDEGRIDVTGQTAGLFELGLGMRIEATGRRNILLRGLMHGLSHREAVARTDEIAAFVDIGTFIDQPVRTYSQGMAMRLAFALTTFFGAEIALLDEWIGAGDQSFQSRANERMQTIVDAAGIVILASHNPDLVAAYCDRVIWMEEGRIHMDGAAIDIVTAYRQTA